MDEFNPYKAPTTLSEKTPWAGPSLWRRYLGFTTVFLINLIVPGLLGWGMSQGQGKIGILVGVSLLFLIGCGLCIVRSTLGRTFVVGGALVCCSQFLPIRAIPIRFVRDWFLPVDRPFGC